MNNNNALEDIAGIIAGVITFGTLGPVVGTTVATAGGVASGIAVGQVLNTTYDEIADNNLMHVLAGWAKAIPWIKTGLPLQLGHPDARNFVLLLTFTFDSTTYNEINNLIQIGAGAIVLAQILLLI